MECQDCHIENPVWFAPSPLWNVVMGGTHAKGDPGGIVCPNCFIKRAEAAGHKPTAWELRPEEDQSALSALRVEAAYCQAREFPMFGYDVLTVMGNLGLCTQEQADAAIAEAQQRVDRDKAVEEQTFAAPQENDGTPIRHPS